MSDTLGSLVGWAITTLGEVAEVVRGVTYEKAHACSMPGTGLVPILRATNIGASLTFDDLVYVPFRYVRPEQYLKRGDVLVATSSGSLSVVGKGSLVQHEVLASFGAFCSVLRPSSAVEPRFLASYLQTAQYRETVSGLAAGVNINNLRRGHLEGLQLRLPPLTEQRRIVAALEEHLSDLDAAVAGLERAKANTLRYRTAVISAAVVGALDSDAPVPAAVDDLRLPLGWHWVTLRDAAAIKGGVTKGQKRRANEPTREVPYLRVANVQRGYLDLQEVKCIAVTDIEIEELRLLPGDVLFNEGGDRDKLGRGWVWSGEIAECVHQNHVFRARVDMTRFNPKFISYYGNTWGQRYFLEQGKQTTNLASINLTKLGGLQIPAPPREVQDEIVNRLERRLAVADRTAAEIDVQLARAARLRQSILKHAFEGKLVPQDPSDEPASTSLAQCGFSVRATGTPQRPARRGRKRSAARRERN